MPLAVFLVSVVALSVVYTWFWVLTGGRLLVAFLLHSATNVVGVVLPKDAGSDFGPVIVTTAFTIAIAGRRSSPRSNRRADTRNGKHERGVSGLPTPDAWGDGRYRARGRCRYRVGHTGTSVTVSGGRRRASMRRCTGQVVAGKSHPGGRRFGLVPDALELVGDLVPEPLTTFIK